VASSPLPLGGRLSEPRGQSARDIEEPEIEPELSNP
jgi:hypothetical protein